MSPPLFNKLDINNLLQPYVDGERSMAWVTDRAAEYRIVLIARPAQRAERHESNSDPYEFVQYGKPGQPPSRSLHHHVPSWFWTVAWRAVLVALRGDLADDRESVGMGIRGTPESARRRHRGRSTGRCPMLLRTTRSQVGITTAELTSLPRRCLRALGLRAS